MAGLQAIAVGSAAIGDMCRSIAAWAQKVGKAKLSAEADDIQPVIDSIQASACCCAPTESARQCRLLPCCALL